MIVALVGGEADVASYLWAVSFDVHPHLAVISVSTISFEKSFCLFAQVVVHGAGQWGVDDELYIVHIISHGWSHEVSPSVGWDAHPLKSSVSRRVLSPVSWETPL